MLIQTKNFMYHVPDTFVKNKFWSLEYQQLFKWILIWYIENHLKFSSIDSINTKVFNNYLQRSEKIILVVSHGLSLDGLNYDNLDKDIFDKIPKEYISNNKIFEE